jgi:hypothetical protein
VVVAAIIPAAVGYFARLLPVVGFSPFAPYQTPE